MSLNPKIIKDSFALAVPIADQVAERFYEYLFQDYPAVVPLFEKVTPANQRKKLISSLVYVVTNLEKEDLLIPFLNNLGSRHTFYGAEEAHYDAVGANL
jgi:nitric oxide dioxygenase